MARRRQHIGTDSGIDRAFWEAYLRERPDVLHQILGDVFREVRGDVVPRGLDDLWDAIAPKFSHRPFGEALMGLLESRPHQSVNRLSSQLSMSRPVLRRFITGEKSWLDGDPEVAMRELAAIARAVGVHPSFFAEWRKLWVLSVIDSALEGQPNLSVALWGKFSRLQQRR